MKKTFAKATLLAALAMAPSLLLGQDKSGVEDMNDQPQKINTGQVAPMHLSAITQNGYTISAAVVLVYKRDEAAKISDDKWIAIIKDITSKLNAAWPEIVNSVSPDDFSPQKLQPTLEAKLKPIFDDLRQKNGVTFVPGFLFVPPVLDIPLSSCTKDGFREKGIIEFYIKGAGKAPDAQDTQSRLEKVWTAVVTKTPHTDFAFDGQDDPAPTDALQQSFKSEVGPILDRIHDDAGNIANIGFSYEPPVADATCKVAPS